MRFLLIDKFIRLTKSDSVVALKSMSADFIREHFPGKPVIPGTLVIESFAQIASWLVIYACEFRYGIVLALLRDSVIREDILPGDQIECHAKILSLGDTVSEVETKGYVNNKLVSWSDFIYSHLVTYNRMERIREINRFNYLTGLKINIGEFS